MSVDKKHYIDELLFSLKNEDAIKLGVLLRHIDEVDHVTQRRLIFELSRAHDSFSLPIILKLCKEKSSLLTSVPELKKVLMDKCSVFDCELCELYDTGEISVIQFIDEAIEYMEVT